MTTDSKTEIVIMKITKEMLGQMEYAPVLLWVVDRKLIDDERKDIIFEQIKKMKELQ